MEMIEGHIAIDPPLGVPVWDIDPYDRDILRQPDDYYAQLRSKGPFAFIPKYSILVCGRHEETKEVFSDWERFVSSRGVGLQDFKLETPWRAQSLVVEADPPQHTRTRKVLTRALSPKATRALAESFQVAADKLIEKLLERGTFEAVEDLAEAYPISVFPDAVGLREADKRCLIDYGAMVFNALGPDNELRRNAMAMGPKIVPWITRQCQRENIKPGGFGATIFEAADAGEITEEEAGMLVRSLLSAGVDTTVTGIGNALWCLATFPDQFQKLKEDPSLTKPAFEEVLRFTTPVHTFCRTADVDTQVSGIKIQKGTKILCVLGAANGDENQWPQAHRFDVTRRPMGHLAMGVGIHGCVGQNLARAEVGAVLNAIVAKVDTIELAGEAIWRPNNAIHALDKMPITFKGG
ncbi:MAG: cytochrome P450 [Rhizobiaceae bacterium]|nr:cytochrome P450 [Rhizobiaceae bacterium]